MTMKMKPNVTRTVLVALAAVLATATTLDSQGRSPDAQRRRNQIQLLEGVLARAVGLGAREVANQMQLLDPSMTVMTGSARARGFALEGYGIFFDVEIPGLRQSVVWSMMTVQRDMQVARAVESLRRGLEGLPSDPAVQRVQQDFQNLQRLVGPPVQSNRQALAAPSPVQPASNGEVTATNESSRPVVDIRPVLPSTLLDDPNGYYTEAVKRQLVDAMLDYGLPIDLGADEWLTVAARDSEGPVTPGEIYDAETIILRVKGSDLAIYAADKSRRDEIRRKVLVSVF